MPRNVVLFDFDGLLVDTEYPAYEAWCTIYSEHQQTLPLEKWVAAVGTWHGFDVVGYLSELTGKSFDRDALFARKEKLKASACDSAPAMKGAIERMREAKSLGWRIGVVSTSDLEWVSTHLRRVGLHAFPEILVTRENVKNVKPHPEPYLTAASLLGVGAQNCVVFEDSLNGIKAAKAAGMYAVAVPNKVTSFLGFTEADRRVESLAQITLRELAGF